VCGIIAFTGGRPAVPVLLEGLYRLEYRGYDSSGIALLTGGGIATHRSVGKIRRLEELLAKETSGATCGIGHTRWATHGRPSEENAHPHRAKHVAVVHNGIIENYLSLRGRLAASGAVFASDTDTEVIPHLLESLGGASMETMRQAAEMLEGAWAIAAVDARRPGEIIVARRGGPLVVGIGEGESFAASDIPALLPFTRTMIILRDGEVARLTPGGITILGPDGSILTPEPLTIAWDLRQAEKGGYRHFMLKEIHEQPEAVMDTLRGRLDPSTAELFLDRGGETLARLLGEERRITILACGTSYHAGLIGEHWLEALAGIPTETVIASEFRYRPMLLHPDRDLVIAISQSGETADTLAALAMVNLQGIPTLAIANVVESSIAREADAVLYTRAGPEIGVASTKAFTSQLTALLLLALAAGRARAALSPERYEELYQELLAVPKKMESLLAGAASIDAVARRHSHFSRFLYLGRNIHHPVAMEGALKLKEISYIHAEAYAAGEMKHGPIALVDENMPLLFVAPSGSTFGKTVSNMKEVQARDGRVILLTSEGAEIPPGLAAETILIPATDELLSPFLSAIPLQLFAYHVADRLGHDVDQPRNLAKSVTVE
jgi:glucosamine--fructose-6-phosphate aminotransferase (isomerizing)